MSEIIVTIEGEFATFVVKEGTSITFEHAVPREDFLADFVVGDMTNIRQVNYEPYRSLYHILNLDYSLTEVENPEDNELIAYIHDNLDSIKVYFETKHAEEEAAQVIVSEPLAE